MWTLGDTGEYFMSCAQLFIQKYNEYITHLKKKGVKWYNYRRLEMTKTFPK